MNNDIVESIEVTENGTTINVVYDIVPSNPRTEWDNLGTLLCWHNRYNLGDDNDFNDPSEFYEWLKKNPAIVLSVYMYEHGGIALQTTSFHDPFDSGQVGFIYVTLEDIRKEYGWKYVTSKRIKQIQSYLEGEIETYSDYLNGDVFGFEVVCNKCEQVLDSCYGFYGWDHKKSGLLEAAREFTCSDCAEVESRLKEVCNETGNK